MARYVIGLAGGIGCGKTTVSDRFAEHGVAVVDADVAARTVVEPGTPALAEIAAHFSAAVLTPDGGLDRAALRRLVFENAAERRWLERLLHPRINALMRRQLDAAESAYALLVNPLMRGPDPRASRILVVDVPESVQVERTMRRDGVDAAQARAIVASQTGRSERLAFADDVLVNDSTIAALLGRVDRLHARYLRLAATA